MNTTEALRNLPRPVRLVDLPGGGSVHVRAVTLAELRRIDARALDVADAGERAVRTAELLCAVALARPDGTPMFSADPSADELAAVGDLTPGQLEEIAAAAVPSKAVAKNS